MKRYASTRRPLGIRPLINVAVLLKRVCKNSFFVNMQKETDLYPLYPHSYLIWNPIIHKINNNVLKKWKCNFLETIFTKSKTLLKHFCSNHKTEFNLPTGSDMLDNATINSEESNPYRVLYLSFLLPIKYEIWLAHKLSRDFH